VVSAARGVMPRSFCQLAELPTQLVELGPMVFAQLDGAPPLRSSPLPQAHPSSTGWAPGSRSGPSTPSPPNDGDRAFPPADVGEIYVGSGSGSTVSVTWRTSRDHLDGAFLTEQVS